MANLIAIPNLSSGDPASGFRPLEDRSSGPETGSFADWLSKASSHAAEPERPASDSPGNDSNHDSDQYSNQDSLDDELDDESAFSGIPCAFSPESVSEDTTSPESDFDGFAAPVLSVPSPISAVGANADAPAKPIPALQFQPSEPPQEFAASPTATDVSPGSSPNPAPIAGNQECLPAGSDSLSISAQTGEPIPATDPAAVPPVDFPAQSISANNASIPAEVSAEASIPDDEGMEIDPAGASESFPPALASPIDPSPRESSPPDSEPRLENSPAAATVVAAPSSSGSPAPVQAPEFSGQSDNQKQSFPDSANSQPEPRAEIALSGAAAPSAPATAAPTMSVPADAPIPSSMNPATLAENLDRIVLNSIRADHNGIRIELEPMALGRVLLRARETSDGLSVEISVQNGEIRSLLVGQEQDLRHSLESQGFHLGRFSVSCRDGDGERHESNHSGQERDQASAGPEDRRPTKTQEIPDGPDSKRLARSGTRNRWVA